MQNLTELCSVILHRGYEVPEGTRQAGRRTEYAVATRSPPFIEDIAAEEYKAALTIASHVYAWAVGMIEGGGKQQGQSERCMGHPMRRACVLLTRAGFQVVPFPVDFQVSVGRAFTMLDLMPNASSLSKTELALRELYGFLYYQLVGR